MNRMGSKLLMRCAVASNGTVLCGGGHAPATTKAIEQNTQAIDDLETAMRLPRSVCPAASSSPREKTTSQPSPKTSARQDESRHGICWEGWATWDQCRDGWRCRHMERVVHSIIRPTLCFGITGLRKRQLSGHCGWLRLWRAGRLYRRPSTSTSARHRLGRSTPVARATTGVRLHLSTGQKFWPA